MGIRGRIDSVFRQDDLRNISSYLLEGARRFALAKRCTAVIVTHPLTVMKIILKKLGFLPERIPKQYVGKSLATSHFGHDQVCENCYKYETLLSPFFQDIPVTFELVE